MNPTPITIAIVDDYMLLRKILGTYLSVHGFAVACEAGNGQELLTLLGNSEKLPDICLLDINMPVMDGFETARQLKNKYPSIKILAYSTSDDKERIEQILQCGAHSFICKDGCCEAIKDALLLLMNKPLLHPHYEFAALNLQVSAN